MASKLYDVADVIIDSIDLYNYARSGEPVDISNLVRSFNIYESLDNFTLQADFILTEGIELLNNFPIVGEEFIEVTLQTPQRRELNYTFFVENITNVTIDENAVFKTYRLQCVTEDFLKNAYTVFTKRYRNRNYDVSLSEVLSSDLSSSVPLVTQEATKGKFDYVVNNVRPFQVIDLITERAKSADNSSSFFYFYQDAAGYHFQTLEKLIKDRKGAASSKEFSFYTGNSADDYAEKVNARNVLSYEMINQGSGTDKIRGGAKRIQVREFDILTGAYYKKHEYNNDFGSFEALDDQNDFNTAKFNADVTKFPAITAIALKDTTRPDMKHNESIVWKRAYEQRVLQYGCRVRVYGDTDIIVGDVVKLAIQDVSGLSEDPQQQELYSENYIVRELKRQCDRAEDGKWEHYMVLDLRKTHMFGKGLG